VADIAQRSSRSIIGGLDWAAPSFASTSSATDILDASNASLLAESGVFSAFDSRKLSREALNAHWNNMPTTIRDAVFGHGYAQQFCFIYILFFIISQTPLLWVHR
jgi:hypothetical protein